MEILKKSPDPRYLAMMEIAKLRDPELRAAALERGLDGAKLRELTLATLTSWLIDHYHDPVDPARLKSLKKEFPGIMQMGNKLRVIIPKQEEPKHESKKPKEKSKRKEKDTKLGIFKGTKKEYTYHLAQDLYKKFGKKYTLKEIVSKFSDQLYQKVTNKFGQVSEKSVKIWMKRYLDTQKW